MKFLKIFVARVVSKKQPRSSSVHSKVNTVNDISVLSSILCALCEKQMFVVSEMFFKSTWY